MNNHADKIHKLSDCMDAIESYGFVIEKPLKEKIYGSIVKTNLLEAEKAFKKADLFEGKYCLWICEQISKKTEIPSLPAKKKELYGLAVNCLLDSAGKSADEGEFLPALSRIKYAEETAKAERMQVPELENRKHSIYLRAIDGAIDYAEILANRRCGSLGVRSWLDYAKSAGDYAKVRIIGMDFIEKGLIALSESACRK